MLTGSLFFTGLFSGLLGAGFFSFEQSCKPIITNNIVVLQWSCFDKDLFGLTLEQASDLVVSHGNYIGGAYDGLSDYVQTQGIQLKLESNHFQDFSQLNTLLGFLKYVVILDARQIADVLQSELSIYASWRDSRMYGSCRRKNYLIAIGYLDRYLLQPGKKLNFNQLISDDPRYCGAETKKFRFYQGVCGASTMLFWNALTNPVIDIEKRSNHNHRYSYFYGGTRGDDAAIYEMSKFLLLKNVSKYPVYFRVIRDSQDNPIIYSFTPKRYDVVTISKTHQSKKKSSLTRQVLDIGGKIKDSTTRISQYVGDNNEKDTNDFPYSVLDGSSGTGNQYDDMSVDLN